MKIADLFVDLHLGDGGDGALLQEVNKATQKIEDKAKPITVEAKVDVDEKGGDRAITVFDTVGSRAAMAAGGIGDLAGALEAQGLISEKTAANVQVAAATVQGLAGAADIALLATELLRIETLKSAAATVKDTGAKAAGIVKTVALTVATGAVAAATGIWTAAQWLLNAALNANPIGIVILAIAALTAGIIILWKRSETFRTIVTGAFNAIKAAASVMWNSVLKPYFSLWIGAFKAIGSAASFLWEKVLKPTFRFITNAFLTVVGALIQGAADAFGWIPGIGGKLKTAAAKFGKFKDDVNRNLSGLKDHTIAITAKGYTTLKSGKFAGKQIPLAMGGPVPFLAGADPNKDSVGAALTPGEFVIRKDGSNIADALKHYGYRGYMKGGVVTSGRTNIGSMAAFNAGFNAAANARVGKTGQARLPADLMTQTGNGKGSLANLIAFGKLLQKMGYSVSENPFFGGVTPGAHVNGSKHYVGRAIDVNHGAGTSAAEQAALARIIGLGHSYGLRSLFMVPGHYNHAHFDYDSGGWLRTGASMVRNNTGKPEAVYTAAQQDRIERMVLALERGGGGAPFIGHADIHSEVDLERLEREQAFRSRAANVGG